MNLKNLFTTRKTNNAMKFNDLITETGFLTLKGNEEMSKTLTTAMETFLNIFEEPLDYDQLYTVKSIMMKTIADHMSDKLKAAPNPVNGRYVDGETIKNGSPLPGGGFIKIGT